MSYLKAIFGNIRTHVWRYNSKEGKHKGNEQRWLLKFNQCELLTVVDVAHDLRVDFLKLAPSHDFETSSRTLKKL